MESNTSENAKGVALQEARDGIAEPYVGMPIYLDDGFFSLLGGRGQCPIADEEDMADVNMPDEDMANEGMPGTMPNQGTCPMPGTMPNQGTCPMPGTMPNQGTCPMPGTMPNQGTCPMPGTMPNQGTCPMPGTMPNQGTCPMPDTMPNQGTCPTPGTMPNQGTCPMPNQGTMSNQYMNGRCMPDQCMPNQGKRDMVGGQFGYNINDCAAGCPLAMAYVPWQSWEKTYEDEVAFRVGTVFPSLDLPFLGGKCK